MSYSPLFSGKIRSEILCPKNALKTASLISLSLPPGKPKTNHPLLWKKPLLSFYLFPEDPFGTKLHNKSIT